MFHKLRVIFRIAVTEAGFVEAGKIINYAAFIRGEAGIDDVLNPDGEFFFPWWPFVVGDQGAVTFVQEFRAFVENGGNDGKSVGTDGGFKLNETEVAELGAGIKSERQAVAAEVLAPGGEFPKTGKTAAGEENGATGNGNSVLRKNAGDMTFGVFEEADGAKGEAFGGVGAEEVNGLFSGSGAGMNDARERGAEGVQGIIISIGGVIERDAKGFETMEFGEGVIGEEANEGWFADSGAGIERIAEEYSRGIEGRNWSGESHDFAGGGTGGIEEGARKMGSSVMKFSECVKAGETAADNNDIILHNLLLLI